MAGRATKWIAVVLFVPLLVILGCSDDSPTAPAGGGGGGGGGDGNDQIEDLTVTLESIDADFLTPNRRAIESVTYLAPFAGASINGPSPFQTNALRVNCFDAGILGKTYEFNGTTYVLSTIEGTPSDVVRFQLYELDDAGIPDLGIIIGHMDLSCDTDAGRTLGVISAYFFNLNFLRISSDINQFQDHRIFGSMTSNLTAENLIITGYGGPAGTGYVLLTEFFLQSEEGFRGGMSSTLDAAQDKNDELPFASMTLPPEYYGFSINLRANTMGDIHESYAFHNDNGDEKHVACGSGTLAAPILMNVSEGGCTVEGFEARDATDQELADLESCQAILRELHLLLRGLVFLNEEGVPQPAG